MILKLLFRWCRPQKWLIRLIWGCMYHARQFKAADFMHIRESRILYIGNLSIQQWNEVHFSIIEARKRKSRGFRWGPPCFCYLHQVAHHGRDARHAVMLLMNEVIHAFIALPFNQHIIDYLARAEFMITEMTYSSRISNVWNNRAIYCSFY